MWEEVTKEEEGFGEEGRSCLVIFINLLSIVHPYDRGPGKLVSLLPGDMRKRDEKNQYKLLLFLFEYTSLAFQHLDSQ